MTQNITLHNVTAGWKVTNTFSVGKFATSSYKVTEYNVRKIGKTWEIQDEQYNTITTARTLKDARQEIAQHLNNLKAA